MRDPLPATSPAGFPGGRPVLRPAQPEDVELLVRLIGEFATVHGHADHHDDEVTRAALGPLLAGPEPRPGVVWLVVGDRHGGHDDAARGGRVDGYAIVTWGYSIESGGRDALLDELYVRRRGEGLGSRAMVEVLEACRGAGASRMFLETERRNDVVRRFYERLGFDVDDSVWMSRDL